MRGHSSFLDGRLADAVIEANQEKQRHRDVPCRIERTNRSPSRQRVHGRLDGNRPISATVDFEKIYHTAARRGNQTRKIRRQLLFSLLKTKCLTR